MVAPLMSTSRRPGLVDWFGPFAFEAPRGHSISLKFSAPVALWEDGDRLWLEVDLPGVNSEDLDVSVHEGKLYIRGERKLAEPDRKYLVNELRHGKFEHVLGLPETLDYESVDATLNGGVLQVSLAKRPEAQPKRIEVKVN